jgi:hypothetical protein
MEKATSDLRQLAQRLERAIPEAARALHQTAADLEQAAQRLLEEVPPPPDATGNGNGNTPGLKKIRRGTVCGRFRNESNTRVSDLRLSGLWLKAAGFDLGQKYEVAVETGKLTVVATERRWSESRSATRREKQPGAQKQS